MNKHLPYLLLVLVLTALFAGCGQTGNDNPIAPEPVPPPTISMEVEPKVVDFGDSVTVTVHSTNGYEWSLFANGEEIPASTDTFSVRLMPEQTQVLHSRVRGENATAIDSVSVLVRPPDVETSVALASTPTGATVRIYDAITGDLLREVFAPVVLSDLTEGYYRFVFGEIAGYQTGEAYLDVVAGIHRTIHQVLIPNDDPEPEDAEVTLELSADSVSAGEDVTVTVTSTHADLMSIYADGQTWKATQSPYSFSFTPSKTTQVTVVAEGEGKPATASRPLFVIPLGVQTSLSLASTPGGAQASVYEVGSQMELFNVVAPATIDTPEGFYRIVFVMDKFHTYEAYLFVEEGSHQTVHAILTPEDEPVGPPPTVAIWADKLVIDRGDSVQINVNHDGDYCDVLGNGQRWPTTESSMDFRDAPQYTTTYSAVVKRGEQYGVANIQVVVIQPGETPRYLTVMTIPQSVTLASVFHLESGREFTLETPVLLEDVAWGTYYGYVLLETGDTVWSWTKVDNQPGAYGTMVFQLDTPTPEQEPPSVSVDGCQYYLLGETGQIVVSSQYAETVLLSIDGNTYSSSEEYWVFDWTPTAAGIYPLTAVGVNSAGIDSVTVDVLVLKDSPSAVLENTVVVSTQTKRAVVGTFAPTAKCHPLYGYVCVELDGDIPTDLWESFAVLLTDGTRVLYFGKDCPVFEDKGQSGYVWIELPQIDLSLWGQLDVVVVHQTADDAVMDCVSPVPDWNPNALNDVVVSKVILIQGW